MSHCLVKMTVAAVVVCLVAAGAVAAVGRAKEAPSGQTALSEPVAIVLSGNNVGVSNADTVEARFRSVLFSEGISLKTTPRKGLAIIVR